MKKFCLVLPAVFVAVVSSCSTAEPRNPANVNIAVANSAASAASSGAPLSGAKIEITEGGPADTVRAFYTKLRDKKFREAIFLTNLRPAIEGLTDKELADFAVDLEAIAGQVPPQLEINGEIITGDAATVTVNLPNPETGRPELQPIKLRKDGANWVILSVDDASEAKIKKDGKNYLYNVRIETHEDEARSMLDRIAKAEMVSSAQNGGRYAELSALVAAGLVPADVNSSSSTGYKYEVTVSGDATKYTASAVPAEYGKSGKLSFIVELDPKGSSRLTSKDNGGKPLKK
ncbi:MAG TPA: hypothetical protein VL501_04205 [Pyrinomonadaceae bacterium]|nr:hypothetical protein [Pyrinomonadaceae bacterium]